VDIDEARAFLRQLTDDSIEMVSQAREGQQREAAVNAIVRVEGAALALIGAIGLPPEAFQEARLLVAKALVDLGYLSRAYVASLGIQNEPDHPSLAEPRQPSERQGKPQWDRPRLVRVIPLNMEVGPDNADAILLLTSLELYNDRIVGRYIRLGGDPTKERIEDDQGPWSWKVSDDSGQQFQFTQDGSAGSLPFQLGACVWEPAPADDATALLLTVQTASGPEPITLPLSA
jgi:hypothetical protein